MSSSRPQKRQRALVVESDRRRAESLISALDEVGYVASVVRHPREVLMALAKPPKLILIDASGPLDPNVELLQGLRRMAATRTVPVLGVHDSPPPSNYDLGQLREHGVREFVARPVRSSRLRSVLAGADPDSLPPLLDDAPKAAAQRAPRPFSAGPSMSMELPPRREVPISNARVAAVGAGGVPAALDFAGMIAEAVITSASQKQLILRTQGPFPPKGQPVRVAVRFRGPVQDAMRDIPVRVIGSVTDIEPHGATRRLRVDIRVVTPADNLALLEAHLAGNRAR